MDGRAHRGPEGEASMRNRAWMAVMMVTAMVAWQRAASGG